MMEEKDWTRPPDALKRQGTGDGSLSDAQRARHYDCNRTIDAPPLLGNRPPRRNRPTTLRLPPLGRITRQSGPAKVGPTSRGN